MDNSSFWSLRTNSSISSQAWLTNIQKSWTLKTIGSPHSVDLLRANRTSCNRPNNVLNGKSINKRKLNIIKRSELLKITKSQKMMELTGMILLWCRLLIYMMMCKINNIKMSITNIKFSRRCKILTYKLRSRMTLKISKTRRILRRPRPRFWIIRRLIRIWCWNRITLDKRSTTWTTGRNRAKIKRPNSAPNARSKSKSRNGATTWRSASRTRRSGWPRNRIETIEQRCHLWPRAMRSRRTWRDSPAKGQICTRE